MSDSETSRRIRAGSSLERLRTFCEVAAAGGISNAVPDDPTRQSQFSRQLKELEEYFETKLLIRKRGRFELTESGRELFQIVQTHFSALQELADRCSNKKIEVRIGAGESLLQWLLLPCLGGLLARHASATLVLRNLQTDNILKMLTDGEIDIGIVRQEVVRAPLKFERLGQIGHRLVVPAAKKAGGTDPWALLRNHQVAVLDGSEVTRALERDAATKGIKLDIVVRASSHAQLVEAVRGAHPRHELGVAWRWRRGRERRGRAGSCSPIPPGGEQAQAEWGCGVLVSLVEGIQFLSQFGVNFFAVVVVVAEGGVDFSEGEVRVLPGDFLGGPAIAEVVGCDLRDADAGKALQSGQFPVRDSDVWIIECRHGCSVARGNGFASLVLPTQFKDSVGGQFLPRCKSAGPYEAAGFLSPHLSMRERRGVGFTPRGTGVHRLAIF